MIKLDYKKNIRQNMDKKFASHHISDGGNVENGYVLIAMADNGDDPHDYIMFQKPFEVDEQDIALS